MRHKHIHLLLFFIVAAAIPLNADTLAILPFYSENIHPADVKKGPQIFKDTEKNDWEFAHLIYTMLKINKIDSLVKPEYIKKAYSALRLSSRRKLQLMDLKNIASEINSERILVSYIYKGKKGFSWRSSIYYKSSNILEDTIVTTDQKHLWELLGMHLKTRFSGHDFYEFSTSNQKNLVFFILNASGDHYDELQELKKILYSSSLLKNSGICAIAKNGKLFYKEPSSSLNSFFQEMVSEGNSNFIKEIDRAAHCTLKMDHSQKVFNPLKKRRIKKLIILVGDVPSSAKEVVMVKNYLRQLALRYKILIMGSSSLKSYDINFWEDTASEISSGKNIIYKNIPYRVKIGLSTGEEYYIVKEGKKIIQTSHPNHLNGSKIQFKVPSELWYLFHDQNIVSVYEKVSGNRVISKSKTNILMSEIILNFIGGKDQQRKFIHQSEKKVKLLIEMEKIPFWINLPLKSISKSKEGSQIKKGEIYYFLLNMQPPQKGIVFRNSPEFGFILDHWSQVPEFLFLQTKHYLKYIQSYLGNSIGKNSLYIFRGRVKSIKYR